MPKKTNIQSVDNTTKKKVVPIQKASPKKIKPELWLSIANLILTATVGIAVAVYLQMGEQKHQEELQKSEQAFQSELQTRDEKFQAQIIELQKNSELANLKMDTTQRYAWTSIFEITNTGLAIAKNVRVSIFPQSFSNLWQNTSPLNSLEDFLVFPLDSSVLYTDVRTRVSHYGNYGPLAGNNTVILEIESMPPNVPVTFTASSTSLEQLRERINAEDVSAEFIIHVAIPKNLTNNSIADLNTLTQDAVDTHLRIIFNAIHTTINVSCENCVSDNNASQLILSYPFGYSVSNIETESNTSNYLKVRATCNVSYIAPIGVRLSNNEIYLEVLTMLAGKPIVSPHLNQKEYFDIE